MTPARPAGTLAVVVPMASAVPEGAIIEGLRSLEVRWILPGQLDTAVAGWCKRSAVLPAVRLALRPALVPLSANAPNKAVRIF